MGLNVKRVSELYRGTLCIRVCIQCHSASIAEYYLCRDLFFFFKAAFPQYVTGVLSFSKNLWVFVRYITWKSVERRSVMASTADIQVNANRGRTTQELHREALSERDRQRWGVGGGGKRNKGFSLKSRPADSGKSHYFSLSFSLSHTRTRALAHTHTHTEISHSFSGE